MNNIIKIVIILIYNFLFFIAAFFKSNTLKKIIYISKKNLTKINIKITIMNILFHTDILKIKD
jgi:hypothetical protein